MDKNTIYQIIEAEVYPITTTNENLAVSGIMKCSEKLERYFNEDSKEKDNRIKQLEQDYSDLQTRNISLKESADEMAKVLKSFNDNYDCDEDAHKYGTECRACKALEVASKYIK